MQGEHGQWLIPPTLLWSNRGGGRVVEPNEDPLRDILPIFQRGVDSDPIKPLVRINYHWNRFRCGRKMKVLPKDLIDQNDIVAPDTYPENRTLDEIRSLTFDFDHHSDAETRRVLEDKTTCLLKKIALNTYYMPSVSNHPCFDSMCVAQASNDTEYLCLFQSHSVKEAISNLNEAAKALRRLWNGVNRKFLFIVFALEGQNAEHQDQA
jgi:hypothetical protein